MSKPQAKGDSFAGLDPKCLLALVVVLWPEGWESFGPFSEGRPRRAQAVGYRWGKGPEITMNGGLLRLESEAERPQARPRPSLPQLLLGAFVVWQLVFLLADNAAPLLPGPAREVIGAAPSAWEILTGKGQQWSLFAPQVPAKALFLVVEAQAQDGLVTRLASF